eukprot:SAG31_NODE_46422_length_254_cov_1.032258_1_plen_84_part_11
MSTIRWRRSDSSFLFIGRHRKITFTHSALFDIAQCPDPAGLGLLLLGCDLFCMVGCMLDKTAIMPYDVPSLWSKIHWGICHSTN